MKKTILAAICCALMISGCAKSGGEVPEAPEDSGVQTVVSEDAEIQEVKEDIMATMEITEFCPEEAMETRNGVEYPEVRHETYRSETTGLDRGVNILLPTGYDESEKYPVLYFLHGIFGDEYSMPSDSDAKISVISTNLAADELAKKMIIVFPNMYATSDPNQQPGFDPVSVLPYDNFINDLVNDLMPYIEENYSVLTGRENTAICGFSMGGRESLFIGLSRPDLFGYCAAFSPAPGLTPGKDWAMEHKGQLSEDELTFEGKEFSPEVLLICCGTKDGTVGTFPESYHKIFEENGVEHVWYEIPDEDHNGKAVRSGFNNFIRYIF